MDTILKAFALLKEPVRYAIAVGVVTGIALFSTDSFINRLGLLKYREEGKPYLGGLLLLCIALAIASGIGFVVKKYDDRRFLRAGQKRLQRLTPEEKHVLRAYIEGQTRSVNLAIDSGVVQGLAAEHIIYRSSNLSNPMAGFAAFAHNIQPWAWDYLNEHRDLLR